MKTNSTIIAASERTQRNAGCKPALLCGIAASLLLAGTAAHAQVNSGSNGSDGVFTADLKGDRDGKNRGHG